MRLTSVVGKAAWEEAGCGRVFAYRAQVLTYQKRNCVSQLCLAMYITVMGMSEVPLIPIKKVYLVCKNKERSPLVHKTSLWAHVTDLLTRLQFLPPPNLPLQPPKSPNDFSILNPQSSCPHAALFMTTSPPKNTDLSQLTLRPCSQPLRPVGTLLNLKHCQQAVSPICQPPRGSFS